MFSRQRAILRLLENEGGRIERLRLVKLAFLVSRAPESPRVGVYDFVPYKLGPFSFTLYHELNSLVRDGWITQSEYHVENACLSTLETAFIEPPFLDQIDEISNRYRSISTADLVEAVYQAYPWYTMNSDVVKKRRAKRPSAAPAVFTVGYEGLMVDALLDLLLRSGVRRLVDVRCNPIARRYGFHKTTIVHLCSNLDIDYVHFPSLGIPSAWRVSLSDQKSYERLFGRYEMEILPRRTTDIEIVANLIAEKPSALMCMEADHRRCHRSRLAMEISRRVSLPVKELRTSP